MLDSRSPSDAAGGIQQYGSPRGLHYAVQGSKDAERHHVVLHGRRDGGGRIHLLFGGALLMPKKITHVPPEYLKVHVGLEFSGKFPRAFGASPYRAALEDLAEGKAEAARFNDATHVRTALKKWAEKLKISAEYAKQGNFLWVRADARRRAPVAEKNDLAAAIMKAVGEVPRTTAE